MQSNVRVVLRNPLDHKDQLDYVINAADNALSRDWIPALQELINSGKLIEKNFCFMGFPETSRNIDYLVTELNHAISTINAEVSNYKIKQHFTVENVFARDYASNGPNHGLLNQLHNHFERLQGTVQNLSDHYRQTSYAGKYAIRQLNNLCHEMENLILSQRKAKTNPDWVRPSQITTWITADRHDLLDEHRQGFLKNGYNRVLGGVYMHWTQIGKTLFEVFRDENAPRLTDTVCEAITHLQYYSGEFDVEWGNDVVYPGQRPWHNKEQEDFAKWLIQNDLDPNDTKLSLGYLPIGQVDLLGSFGTTDHQQIWHLLSSHLDIYKIEVNEVTGTYDYCWTDSDYQQQQIERLRPGYDYQTRSTK